MENENQILLLLGEIKGQMSGFFQSLAETNKRQDDHESRIRAIETNSTKQRGVLVGMSLLASGIVSAIAFAAHLIWK